MARPNKDIDTQRLLEWAEKYIDHCLESTKEIATSSGVKTIRERHLPTISFFLLVWLPRQNFEFYNRSTYYQVLSNVDHPCHDATKQIDEIFRSLAADVVANEGKGIFYAKNLLGWSDKAKNEEKQEIIISFADENSPSETA